MVRRCPIFDQQSEGAILRIGISLSVHPATIAAVIPAVIRSEVHRGQVKDMALFVHPWLLGARRNRSFATYAIIYLAKYYHRIIYGFETHHKEVDETQRRRGFPPDLHLPLPVLLQKDDQIRKLSAEIRFCVPAASSLCSSLFYIIPKSHPGSQACADGHRRCLFSIPVKAAARRKREGSTGTPSSASLVASSAASPFPKARRLPSGPYPRAAASML